MLRFYSNSVAGSGRVTVIGEHKEGVLRTAVSRCSNRDHFTKDKGVLIASSRLNAGKTYMEFETEDITPKQFIVIAKGIAKKVEQTKQVY
jgi:hypothetical protein